VPDGSQAQPLPAEDAAPPLGPTELLRLINGFQVSHAISVAATLGIPDLLRHGPRACDELARATATHPRSLYRLLRALAAVAILREESDRSFALTPLGEPLLPDAAASLDAWAQLVGSPSYRLAWRDLIGSVRTGETAFGRAHGMPVWEYRALRPDEAALFDRAMATMTGAVADALVGACDLSAYATFVDIGGGEGALIRKLLAAYPQARGILFDQPHVVTRAEAGLEAAGLAERCVAVGGDFFAGVPAGGDAYLLKWILHDWPDEQAIAILRSCRRAIRKDGVLLAGEHVLGPANEGAEGKLMDLNMMVITGGIERTREEFARLFGAAGFELTRVIDTATPFSLVEGKPR
jgi:O-methyltransferase domain/Dimerisation domain